MAVEWRHETFPVPPPPDGESITEVLDAFLSPYATGPLRTIRPRSRWTRGAVYDAQGNLVPSSQRVVAGGLVMAADPVKLGPGVDGFSTWPVPVAETLEGTWLYAGTWMNQFGHFVAETVTTLWPEDTAIDGLVAHPFVFRAGVAQWQLDLLQLLGMESLPRLIVGAATRVERLLVPTRTFVPNGYATATAGKVWNRIASAVPQAGSSSSAPVFLSRTHWHHRLKELGRPVLREVPNEEVIDGLMASKGIRVVFPEELTVGDQISTVRSAGTLIALGGSALHLSAFAEPGTRVLEIGDARSRTSRLPNQRVIDTVCGHPTAFVPFTGGEGDGVDLLRVERALDGL